MALTTDPAATLQGARNLQEVQQQWENVLLRTRPKVPVSSFGTGLQAQGARLLELVQRGHDVRIAHARRLQTAGVDGAALVQRVEGTDVGSASALQGGER